MYNRVIYFHLNATNALLTLCLTKVVEINSETGWFNVGEMC